ncbi:P-loop containing nucleoside triphosphate hydrolase protein [Dendrothele bispora CBS 962.96]|uniref:DNA 3'-5' helicase n=1 Tax=Dendrothele bispora (strain CBS 962.96) TaxID=1314807 RepID=A0A4S8LYD3_DENBC|nr:P-loop containing nucleoside triphosphate hydrolase protein [Dendrothele bispora CBS 962.96]
MIAQADARLRVFKRYHIHLRNMANRPCWTDSLGADTLKQIVSRRVLQWTNGLHDYQVEPLQIVLDQQDLLFISGTGCGKSAFFIIPIVVHQEILAHPNLYPAFPVKKNPVVIVVTPTKGLANSIIYELQKFGLSGISYCHETLSTYYPDRLHVLVDLICACQTWQLICVDPEHLASPEWRKIIQHDTFKLNLILFCIDEAHLIKKWGPAFRPAFENIGSFIRGYLPLTTSTLALTATCDPDKSTRALCESLGLIILDIAKRTPGVPKYAQILDYLRCGRKTVIHVNTIPIAYEIYEFLWNHIPKGHSPLRRMRMYHALCTDEYNRTTFQLIDSDSELQVVIATVGFSQGINCKSIEDSISWGFPSSLDEFWQAKGRAGRDPTVTCRGIGIVTPNLMKMAQEVVAALKPHDPAASKNTNLKKTKLSYEPAMEENKALFLTEQKCRTGFLNRYYGNPPQGLSELDCESAGRTVYCDLCSQRYNVHYPFSHTPTRFPWTDVVARPTRTKKRKSKINLGTDERKQMRIWLVSFRELVWNQFEQYDPTLCNHPIPWFFPDPIIDAILDNFLIIQTLDDLVSLLSQHDWKYTDQKSESLYRLLSDFQVQLCKQRKEEEEEREERKKTRKKDKQIVVEYDEESRAPSPTDSHISSSSESAVKTIIPPATTRHSSWKSKPQPQGTVADWMASYGPQRNKRR